MLENSKQNNVLKLALIGCLGLIIVVIMIGVISVLLILGHRNTAVSLQEQVKAQKTANASNYDNMWKRFREAAQVTDMQADDVKKVYTDMISGRYGNDTNLLFKTIQESNPKMNDELYSKLQNEVTAGRIEFDRNQMTIADQIREYNTFIRHHFVMNLIFKFPELDSADYIITSDRTQNAIETGKDEEVKLRGDN